MAKKKAARKMPKDNAVAKKKMKKSVKSTPPTDSKRQQRELPRIDPVPDITKAEVPIEHKAKKRPRRSHSGLGRYTSQNRVKLQSFGRIGAALAILATSNW
jgi:hypothetical protein